MPTTAERLAKLEAIQGDWDTVPKLSQGETPTELPNGRYDLKEADYQIRMAIADLYAKLAVLPTGQPSTIPPPAPSQTVDAGAVIAKLAADYNVHFADGKIGIGMVPDPDASAQLQLCSDRGASILGRSNTEGTDGQNPGEVHTNEIHLASNDGGLRFLQYGFWGKNGFKRNTTNRAFSVLALDAEGDICQSKVAVGATQDGGQLWYIITNFSRKVIQFCTFQVGWKVEIAESQNNYSDRNVKRL